MSTETASAAGAAGAALGLTADILRSLERLSIPSRRTVPGASEGRRRSRRYGSSLELADYRAYVPGDDIRRLDWGAYARLGKLFTRLYAGEDDACVTFWLDASASMSWDHDRKRRPALSVAGALGFVSLIAEDRVACCGFAETVHARAGPFRGKRSAPRLWATLASMPGGVLTEWACIARAARSVPRGLAVVISDFLAAPGGIKPALSALRMSGSEVLMLQVLSPEEIHPSLQGELRLVDSETAGGVEITMSQAAMRAYHEARAEHEVALRALATAHDARLVTLDGGAPLRQLLLGDLVRARVLG
ncbi:MAG TPA: DUF58 domain-containing protein [Acidimicrobiales bacterium]|nr:DUF58 domain-containing protein [Acidimicrobiales bacterium]